MKDKEENLKKAKEIKDEILENATWTCWEHEECKTCHFFIILARDLITRLTHDIRISLKMKDGSFNMRGKSVISRERDQEGDI